MGEVKNERIDKLVARILTLAYRERLNNIGRVLMPELEVEGYTYDEIIEALSKLRRENYKVLVVGEVIKAELK